MDFREFCKEFARLFSILAVCESSDYCVDSGRIECLICPYRPRTMLLTEEGEKSRFKPS